MRSFRFCLVLSALAALPFATHASTPAVDQAVLDGLVLRGIGPALMGGRIADIAIDPSDRSTWYLAVGSGGVWKSDNSGVTWRPIFDDQPSYSIGCITIDPSDSNVVWVGTGENVSGRHVGWGDGVYKSLDGGESWQAMGLAASEHISKIVVHPDDSEVAWVAAEGPLWSPGGERGLYKTSDGGATWRQVLSIDSNTGVTSLDIDPRDPDVLYAASYERRRTVWSHLAGGPGSGIHKSTDGGETWHRLERGLPKGDMGKIGLAVSPVEPDVVYATIEANEEERGFYRSLDRGASWEKRNGYLSNGTGPHYYQEIYASPHDVDHVYQMDVFMHFTPDGGKTFEIVGTGREKHSDNHALYIDPDDPRHLLAGTDASLYETFDHGVSWRQTPNLPISQFYKLDVSQEEPFYSILGGAQDLGTLIGPARNNNNEGIRNQDWTIPLGADGYSSAFDREDPNLLYIEWQGGRLVRFDRRTEEAIDIQPVPAPGDGPERFNWDAPVRTSAHSPTRLYFASHRLWRSDDRGDSWTAISGDLTRGENRYELAVGGRVRSIDALYDNGAMSWYATVTTLAESELDERLLYTGSDDGLIQVSEDGGASWRRAAALPGVPERAFINDLRASLHDSDTVYAVADAHKQADYRPLVFRSRDRGRSWTSLSANLPERSILWAIDEDHITADLLFLGAEHGLWCSLDGGRSWLQLGAGVPTIAFRDLAIQRQHDDLVGATFGRGFYVLDDYSPLRAIAGGALDGEGALFPVRDAWWYTPQVPGQAAGVPSLGSDHYRASNPPLGAVFTVFLKEAPKSNRELRHETEKAQREAGDDVSFPGWDGLRAENLEPESRLLLTIRDSEGTAVRRIEASPKAGIQRLHWDLRRQPPEPIDLDPPSFRPPWAGDRQGAYAGPGVYTAELTLTVRDASRTLGESRSFAVKPVPGSSLAEPDYVAVAAFQRATSELLRRVAASGEELRRVEERIRHWQATLIETPAAGDDLFARLSAIRHTADDLRLRLLGDRVRGRRNEPSVPSIQRRVGQIAGGHWGTRQTPTQTQHQSLDIASRQFETLSDELTGLLEETLPAFAAALEAAGAPWTP